MKLDAAAESSGSQTEESLGNIVGVRSFLHHCESRICLLNKLYLNYFLNSY